MGGFGAGVLGKNVDPNGKNGNLITRRIGAKAFSVCLDCRKHEIVEFSGAQKESSRVETMDISLIMIRLSYLLQDHSVPSRVGFRVV